ncbi:MAG: hypothetical protein JW866_08060, partial [Ignavibacteriales bacterium]|nr:hypothetical protein [Ignavibacteriales bacterium]
MNNLNKKVLPLPEKRKQAFGKIICVIIILCSIFSVGFVLQRGNRNTNQRTNVTTKNYTISTSTSTRDNFSQSSFNWKYVDNNLKSNKYNLTFKLTTDEVQQALNYLKQVENMSDKELGCSHIKNKSSIEYYRAYWHAVYTKLYNFEHPKFDKIVSGFKDIFSKEGFSNQDKMLFLMTFVQNITYKRPGDYLDIIPGKVTISKRYGDCDTKSMLLYILFEKFGIDCVMFWSYQYSHAMLGVNTSASGYSKTHNGKKYYFLETTY